jgi:hypothetical protein
MCPACIAGAASIVAGVVSTGGLTAVAAKLFKVKRASRILSQQPKQKEK